jgi:type I restriction enzyme S subunit
MSNWKKYKLGELYNIFSGLSKPTSEFGFGYPFVTFKDVFYNYFLPDELTSLANTNEKERKSCSVKKGDIFLTRTSETFDELGMSAVSEVI